MANDTNRLHLADEQAKPKVELRDYFIAHALTGLCAAWQFSDFPGYVPPDTIIKLACETARRVADEMLIERER